MKIPESIISQIQNNLDIVDVISDYTQVQKKGGRYWAICPFHSEKTPSFSITPDKGVFYCFGCHKGGTVYTFIMEVEKLSFAEAVKFLAPRAGVEIDVQVDQKQLSHQEALRDLYARLGKAFHHILLNNDAAAHARAYLDKRKIPREMIDLFQIGYIPGDRNWLKNFLLQKNYSAEFLFHSGLFSQKYSALYPIFTNRIMFPILDRQGRTIAFGGRALDDSGPKYINSPETPIFLKKENLFGWYQAIDSIKKSEAFYLVEGYFDVIALRMAGVENTLAPLGTAFTLEQAKLLNRYVKKGYLLFDNDNAGQKATERTIEILQQTQIEINIILLEKEKDPADILLQEGKEELQKLLKYSINYFQYLIKRAVKHYNPDTAEGKEKIFQFLYPYVEN
ncbi:MAG: DNA primase, partial [Spirochaetales bacterium]|nr:DNA primase [Spirochaetales bacterium]